MTTFRRSCFSSAAGLMVLLGSVAFAQSTHKSYPVFVEWTMNGGEPDKDTSGGPVWADHRLGLDVFRAYRTPPASVVVKSMPRLVRPYRHLFGRAIVLNGRTGEFDDVRLETVRNREEYMLRLKELDWYFDDRATLPGASVRREGPPEQRIVSCERHWLEEERETTRRVINGVTVIASRVITDENNNSRMVARDLQTKTYLRFDENVYIRGDTDSVFSVPARQLARPEEFKNDDWTVFLDVDSVPTRLREKAWQKWSIPEVTRLQRRDAEDPVSFALRHSFGENRLSLLRSAFFGVRKARVSASCESDAPWRIYAALSAVRNSRLAECLRELGRAPRRLPDMRTDLDWLHLHWSSGVPQEAQHVLDAAVAYNEHVTSATLPAFVKETISRRSCEIQICGRADPVLGLGLIGAMSVANSAAAGTSRIKDILHYFPSLKPVPVTAASGREFYRVSLDVLRQRLVDANPIASFHCLPEFGFLHLEGNILWFACGGESVCSMLDREIEMHADNEPSNGTRGTILTAHLDLSEATTPVGEVSGLTDWLIQLERDYAAWDANRFLTAMGRSPISSESGDIEPVCRKALRDGPAEADAVIVSRAGSIESRLTFDYPIALFFYGRQALNHRVFENARTRAFKRLPKGNKQLPNPRRFVRTGNATEKD